ncbi:hypothetical protein [Geofilum rhodophaeum]|uniref:hypothetical protein n=1 Tax=Geofilum rhodophaeum TaxID=1965019 RepID=UPI000B52632B|nr:hypothetical protein [Geofilum rhodophaeum]
MKHKRLLIATIIFFLLINTTYFWQGKLGMFVMVTSLLLIVSFIVLTVLLLRQIYISIKEKLIDKQRLIVIAILALTLAIPFFFPGGLINFEKFESESILIAQREGAANCLTTLKLKANKKFNERTVCFGITEITGTYNLKGDTIFFDYDSPSRQENESYKFAIIKNSDPNNKKHKGDLVRFKNNSDTTGIALWIIKNELTK